MLAPFMIPLYAQNGIIYDTICQEKIEQEKSQEGTLQRLKKEILQ